MGERRWEQSRGRGAEQQMKFVQTRSVRKRYKGQSGLSPLSAVRSSPFALHSLLFTFRSPLSGLLRSSPSSKLQVADERRDLFVAQTPRHGAQHTCSMSEESPAKTSRPILAKAGVEPKTGAECLTPCMREE